MCYIAARHCLTPSELIGQFHAQRALCASPLLETNEMEILGELERRVLSDTSKKPADGAGM